VLPTTDGRETAYSERELTSTFAKNGHAPKKRSSRTRRVHGVSSEAGRESIVGKICEKGRS